MGRKEWGQEAVVGQGAAGFIALLSEGTYLLVFEDRTVEEPPIVAHCT